MSDFNRSDFAAEMSAKMDHLRNTNINLCGDDPDSRVFCYAVANDFDTLDDGKFVYTDGPNDLGIDFYVKDGEDFRIYQCKSSNLGNLTKGAVFDANPVNELAEAIEYLTLGNKRPASASIQKLRGSYQLSKEDHTLTATLAIEGRLSPSGLDRFKEVQSQYRSAGVEVNLIDEEALYARWHSFDNLVKPQKISIKLEVFNNGLMRMNNWFCAAISVGSLLKAMNGYGNALFDSNVRSKLRNSRINADIKKTISTPKGRKQFIHLNNGLVITCNNYTFNDGQSAITLQGAQVVNGCQTMTTIYDYYCKADQKTQQAILDDLHLMVKVISSNELNKGNLLDDIIVASNNQNPMNPRNLKSNSIEQRQLQEQFAHEPLRKELRFFYIRKDGELEAFVDAIHAKRTLKKSDFLIPNTNRRGKNRYRHIDNEDLGKCWLSWIGNSPQVNSGAIKIFSNEGIYSDIYERRPGEKYWARESSPDFSFDRELLEAYAPTPFQLLVAIAFSTYLQARIKPDNSSQFKQKCIERLKQSGIINNNASDKDVSKALSGDKEYLDTIWMNQMTFGLTEIAAFILLRCFGDLQSDTCKKLLDRNDLTFWLSHGMDKKLVNSSELQGGLLYRVFGFMKYAVCHFFNENRQAILLENRPKLYLGRRESIAAIKHSALNLDESMINYPHDDIKGPGETFIEALRKL